MTARELHTAVKDDLQALFAARTYKAPPPKIQGTPEFNLEEYDPEKPPEEPTSDLIMEKLGVYEQDLPIREKGADDPFPYIIVRLSKGGIATPVDPHKVDIFLLIGIYDNDRRNIGHKTVLEIIEDIQKHYEKHPTLCGGAFQFTDPFTWVLQDEPSYPYFYGGCNLSFNLAAPRTESRFT